MCLGLRSTEVDWECRFVSVPVQLICPGFYPHKIRLLKEKLFPCFQAQLPSNLMSRWTASHPSPTPSVRACFSLVRVHADPPTSPTNILRFQKVGGRGGCFPLGRLLVPALVPWVQLGPSLELRRHFCDAHANTVPHRSALLSGQAAA